MMRVRRLLGINSGVGGGNRVKVDWTFTVSRRTVTLQNVYKSVREKALVVEAGP